MLANWGGALILMEDETQPHVDEEAWYKSGSAPANRRPKIAATLAVGDAAG